MDDALDYAKEVYAACLTIGFTGEDVARLKRLIDAYETAADAEAGREADLVRAAQRAHLEAANWAGRG